MGFIYLIYNDINDKVYIGQTVTTIANRWSQHKYNAFNEEDKYHYKLYSAIRKYGIEHFNIEEVEECTNNILSERETYWIEQYDSYYNGYNMTLGGEGTVRIADSEREEIRQLWNEGLSINKIAIKTNHATSTIHHILDSYGILDHKEAVRRGVSDVSETKYKTVYQVSLTGELIKTFDKPEDVAQEIGISTRTVRRYCKEKTVYHEKFLLLYNIEDYYDCKINDNPRNCKPVVQFDINGNKIAEYKSIAEAQQITGINNISKICIKKDGVAGGYQWRYLGDEPSKKPKTCKKKVVQMDKEGNDIKIWDSISEAARATGQKNSSNITQVCKGNVKTAGGYRWRYLEDDES